MDARIQKIQIASAKFDSEGNVRTPEVAVIALEVPMDSVPQKEAIIELLSFLGDEWVKVEIAAKQLRLDFEQQKVELAV